MTTLWTPGRTLAEVEKDVIFLALRFYNNNKTQTAKSLGIAINTLSNKLEIYHGNGLPSEPQLPLESSAQDHEQKQSVSVREREEVQEMLPESSSKGDSKAGKKGK